MGSVKVKFADLEDAISQLNTAATSTKTYASQLKSDNFTVLENIPGGSSYYTSSALSKMTDKTKELSNGESGVADRLSKLASKLGKFRDNVQTADSQVNNYIVSHADITQTKMGVQSSTIENFWFSICDGVRSWFNQTEFGQMISSWVRQFDSWLEGLWDDFKIWYKFEGGEFILNIVAAVVVVVISVITIVTAGVGFLAVVAVIGAICGIINAVAKIGSNVAGLVHLKNGDPAWAHRLVDNEDWADLAQDEKHGNSGMTGFWNVVEGLGHVVNVIDGICAVIDFADFTTGIFEKATGKSTMFQKYFGSQGMFDHAMIKIKNPDAARFDNQLKRWVKLDANGKMTKEVIDFRYKDAIFKDHEFKLFKGKRFNQAKNGLKHDFMLNKMHLVDKLTGKKVIYGNGIKFKWNPGYTSANEVFKGIKQIFKENTAIYKCKEDFGHLQDAIKYKNAGKGISVGMKGILVGSIADNGIKAVERIGNIATVNFDDLSESLTKARDVVKKTFAIESLPHESDMYDNWNSILG